MSDNDELTDAEKSEICARCEGSCCTFRAMNITFGDIGDEQSIEEYLSEPIDFSKVDGEAPRGSELIRQSGTPVEMRWYLSDDLHEGTLHFECEHRTDEGKCGIYDDRPQMCRRWECAALRGEMSFKEFLQTHYRNPREIEEADLADVSDEVTAALEGLDPLPMDGGAD